MTTINTIIGVALAVVGGTVQSGGFILQKFGHNKVNKSNENKQKDEHRSVLSEWVWYIGIMVYSVGGIMNSAALNFAAQSIISPISALNLATIALLSYFILKEPLSIKDMIAIIIIIVGIVLVVVYGPSGDDNVDIEIDALRGYFQQFPYIVTVTLLTGITFIDYIGVKYAEHKNFKTDTNDKITYGSNFLLFSYVWISAFFASNNTLFIKSFVSIIFGSISSLETLKENATDYLSYFIIIIWVICLFSMEYFRQKALGHFGALYVIPIFYVSSIILTAVLGMIFFEEYTEFTLQTALLFALGIIITIIGVLVLSLDISKIWTDLYDEDIKVAMIDYDHINYKYPKTVVYGGPTSEYFTNYHFKHPAICYNEEYDFLKNAEIMNELEPVISKYPDV